MSICVCNNSALELYRASSRLLPELMSSARTSKLESGRLLSERLLAEDMRRVGVTEKPFHVLLGNTSCGRGRDDIVRHPCSDGLPPRSIIRASRDVWTVSPEYLMCQYAARAADPSDPFDLVDLILGNLPRARVLLWSPLPCVEELDGYRAKPCARSNDLLRMILGQERELIRDDRVSFLDVFDAFLDERGRTRAELYADGLHLTEEGFRRLADLMRPELARLLEA